MASINFRRWSRQPLGHLFFKLGPLPLTAARLATNEADDDLQGRHLQDSVVERRWPPWGNVVIQAFLSIRN